MTETIQALAEFVRSLKKDPAGKQQYDRRIEDLITYAQYGYDHRYVHVEPRDRNLFERIFDWFDINVCSARYDRQYKHAYNRLVSLIENERKHDFDTWKQKYERSEKHNQSLKHRIDVLNNHIENIEEKLHIRRAMTRPVNQERQFEMLKQKRIAAVAKRLPPGFGVTSLLLPTIYEIESGYFRKYGRFINPKYQLYHVQEYTPSGTGGKPRYDVRDWDGNSVSSEFLTERAAIRQAATLTLKDLLDKQQKAIERGTLHV